MSNIENRTFPEPNFPNYPLNQDEKPENPPKNGIPSYFEFNPCTSSNGGNQNLQDFRHSQEISRQMQEMIKGKQEKSEPEIIGKETINETAQNGNNPEVGTFTLNGNGD